jgi:hypothetical protein
MLPCILEEAVGLQPKQKTSGAITKHQPATALARWCLALLCLPLVVLGCGRPVTKHVDLTGKVLYQGAPVQGGRVTFVAIEGGYASTGEIDESGEYKINAPPGEVTISVDNRMVSKEYQSKLPAQMKKGAGNPNAPPPSQLKGTYRQIPSKYYTVETSGLTYKVNKGENTHDIVLTD